MRLIVSLSVYLLVLIIKIIAYYFSNLLVILADAMHSIADIAFLLILIVASHISKKAADRQHPFGHGLVKNLASLVVSIAFITLISFELLKEGFERILNPKSYENIDMAIFAEMLVLLLLFSLLPLLSRGDGILDKTAMMETVNDSLSTLAALIGIMAVKMGYSIFDGISAIAVALLIAYNSFRLFKENAMFLLGFSPPMDFYSKVGRSVMEVKGVNGVHEMLAVYTAEREIHLDMHVTIDKEMKIEDAEKLSNEIVKKLKAEFPEIKHVSIHFCPIIDKKDEYTESN